MRVLVSVLLVIASTYATKTCKPGESFEYFCNTCTCGDDGIVDNAACTKKYCDPDQWNENGSRKDLDGIGSNPSSGETTEVSETEETCVVGESFRYYCNTCFCDDGTVHNATCTRVYCDHNLWNKDGTRKVENDGVTGRSLTETTQVHKTEDTCVPGETFNYYCNTCFCLDDGLASNAGCTKIYCNREEWNKDGSRKNLDDVIAEASLNEPTQVHKSEDTCVPGESFKYYCNTCFCGDDGLASNAGCTKIYCNREEWNKDGSRKDLVEVITDASVDETTQVHKSEDTCVPGESFNYYCNTCFCLDDGLAANAGCTKIYCNREEWNKDGSRKDLDEVIADASLDETTQVHKTEDTCVPGESFKYYCNTCFCGNDGLASNAGCTRMYCNRDVWNKNGSRKLPNRSFYNPFPHSTDIFRKFYNNISSSFGNIAGRL